MSLKVIFISLGCDKNLVDTQQMAGILETAGVKSGRYVFTDDEEQAQIAIVNTCCFIDSAKEESIESILSLAELKNSAALEYLIVTGCMAQRYKDEILKRIPEVDAVIGTTAQKRLEEILDEVTGQEGSRGLYLDDPDLPPSADVPRAMTQLSCAGYLKIADGCDKCCTYCAIPYIRGHFRSVPMEELIIDAKRLVATGTRELILVAQETTLYGTDLYGKKMLPELLRRLCLLKDLKWIRLLYCYPEEITDELIDVMSSEAKILPYLDIPIQHSSDAVLKRMGRRTTGRELEEIIKKLRERIPGICLRTTLITGFPGETEEDHRALVSFVKRMKFERLGVFTYSREEGTPAARMEGQVHPSTKKRRQKELMLAQQEIAFKNARKMKNRVLDVIIDGKLAGEDVYAGRTYMDVPGVDSNIVIETKRELMTGDFVRARVTGAQAYDLIGEIADED